MLNDVHVVKLIHCYSVRSGNLNKMLLGWIMWISSSRPPGPIIYSIGQKGPRYYSITYLEKVKLSAVVCVHEQTLALCRAEFEGKRRVGASVPLRETGVGRFGAMQV